MTLIVGLMLALVLVAPVPAFAECAWVLWSEVSYISSSSPPSEIWVLIGASPAYEQCEQSRIAKARALLRVTESDRSGPNVARVSTEEQGNIVTKTTYLKDGGVSYLNNRLSCLPDTIDPRGPKGGAR